LAMRLALTKYGLPQVIVFPATILAIMLTVFFIPLPIQAVCLLELILAVVLVWLLAFFRDPYRPTPEGKDILLAPADGRITGIETVENEYTGDSTLRIGIFLSIFDVHINRSPCNVKVEKIVYKKGRFKDARHPLAGSVNESNDLYLRRLEEPQDKLIVRQISGVIARRIVCGAGEGQNLAGGQKFGMIKFGSRTELYIPANENVRLLVRRGQRVKAGLTVLARYE